MSIISSRRFRIIAMLVIPCIMLTACHNQRKFMQTGDRTLSHNYFSIEYSDEKKAPKEIKDALADIKKYTRQDPNKRFMGKGPRVKMHTYCLSKPNKSNWINNYLRKQGEEPSVYSEDLARETCERLTGLLESKGCFNSTVTFDTAWIHRYDVDVTYHLHPSRRYKISNVTYRAETPEINKLLRNWQKESLIEKNEYYDQDKLDQERSRLSDLLRNEGYYLASTNIINYLVDTAFDDYTLTIQVNVRNPQLADSNRNMVTVPLQKYRLDQIYVYHNTTVSATGSSQYFDTVVESVSFRNFTTDYYHLFSQPMSIKPRVINRSIMLFHGQTYRPTNTERTYNSLLNMRNFKYINIEYSESPNSSDTARLLNAKVRLLNAKKQKISASIEINNSSTFNDESQSSMNGNMGLETKISYQNKNIFGGAQIFKAEGSLLIELPKLIFSKNNDDPEAKKISSFESGLDLSLNLPSFLFPFTADVFRLRMRPHTVISVGGSYQYRSYFERLLYNTSFGYSWNRNVNSHQLLPIELTYVRFFNIDSLFQARMASFSDARIKYQYSDHFIMDIRYDYVYNTQIYSTRNNFNYIHLSLETAGNLLNAIATLTSAQTDDEGVKEIFGVPFSQYVRFYSEFKRYFYIGKKSTFVTRLMAGIGLPYLNSNVMPYEKSFYGGGPSTIRAWHLRYLGPGNFQANDDVLERVGDIQLVANLEYRFPLISIFEGALFTDLGNVWLTHQSDEFPGGQFRFKDFYKGIAAGVGLGLRANISIVTIRCDFAIPLYDPGKDEDKRWRPEYWKLNQILINFGIDYPF